MANRGLPPWQPLKKKQCHITLYTWSVVVPFKGQQGLMITQVHKFLVNGTSQFSSQASGYNHTIALHFRHPNA